MSMVSFLDLEARVGGEFIHPGGWVTTHKLIELLALSPGLHVLDLGSGAGASAALVAERSGARVTGLERSQAMLAASQRRLRHHQAGRQVSLVQADGDQPWPFVDGAFDAVYAESVAALLEVSSALAECWRVLKPGGSLVLNERIWKPGQSQATVDQVNALSRRLFGIPAATRQPFDRQDWLEMLEGLGFVALEMTPVDDLLGDPQQSSWSWRQKARRGLSYLVQPQLVAWSFWYKTMLRRHAAAWLSLESYVFCGRKPGDVFKISP